MQPDVQTQTRIVAPFSSIRAVMTEDLTTRLIDLREKVSALQWQAGDLVNDLYAQVMSHTLEISIMDVCRFVSENIDATYSPATLRIYAAVARFYPQTIRENYLNILPFWVFRYAAQFGCEHSRVFDYVHTFCDEHARLPYEREVRACFEPTKVLFSGVKSEFMVTQETPVEATQIENSIQCMPKRLVTLWLRSLVHEIPSALPEIHNREAEQILSQIQVLANQVLALL